MSRKKPKPNPYKASLHRIAADLRSKLKGMNTVPKKVLSRMSDMDVCMAYFTCARCKSRLPASFRMVLMASNSTEHFIEACNVLLAIHYTEEHGEGVMREDEDGNLIPVPLEDLRAQLNHLLGKCKTVWETAMSWATENFSSLPGQEFTHDALVDRLREHIREYPGETARKWLFVYSPASVNTLFEVADEGMRFLMACTKLKTVEASGGIIFGVDASTGVRSVVPLVVCKPSAERFRHS